MTMSDKDYTLPKNTLYSKGQPFGWRANYDEALIILGLVHEIIDVDILFDYYSFPDSVMEEMASWSLKDLALSALFYYLETVILNNKKRNSDFLTTYNWKKITTLILNSGISSDVLQFIEEVDLRKCSSDKIIISGGQKAIENLYNLDKIKIHKIGLINLLVFLKYGLATSELLVNEALENKSVANIIALLSSFEGDLDKKLILTTILKSYQNYKDQEEITIFIKKSFDEVYKSQIIGSENFNIFDMFESSENFKARTPQIMFSLFCQDLFKDLTDDKISNSLLLFELFEEYLISSEDKIFLFKNLSLKSLKDFEEINQKFISAKKPQIEAILEKRKSVFSKYYRDLKLKNLVGFMLLFCLIVISVVGAVAGFKIHNENRDKRVYQPPHGLVNAPFASITGNVFNISPPRKPVKAATPPLAQVQVVSQQSSTKSQTASQKVTFSAPSVAPLSQSRTASKAAAKAALKQKMQSAPIAQQVIFVVDKLNNNSNYREPADVNILVNTVSNETTIVDPVSNETTTKTETQANILNSSGCYQDLATAQRNFGKNVKITSMTAQPVSQDKEHLIVKPLREGLTIPDAQGGCFLFLKGHHVKHTDMMVYVLPDSCGYTKNEGLLEYHESIQVTYIDKLDKMYETNPQPQYLLPNNIKGIEDLAKYGITPDQVVMATEKGFAIDRNTILGMGIPEKALLPWCHSNMIHLKQADAFKDFVALLNPGQGSRGLGSNPKQASQMIENAMLTGFDAIDHYRVVSTILKPGSAEAYIADRAFNQHMIEAGSAVEAVRLAGGTVDPQLEATYFSRNRPLITLSDAEDLALMDFKLKDPKGGCKSVFTGYYKKK